MSHFFVRENIRGLLSGVEDKQRLSCAIKLMKAREPEVKQAYIQALNDSFDKVVAVACFELSSRGGSDSIEALYGVLKHPFWRVRLQACKALMVLKAADEQVVSTLERMAQEPEASEYDAEHEELESMRANLEIEALEQELVATPLVERHIGGKRFDAVLVGFVQKLASGARNLSPVEHKLESEGRLVGRLR
jgi:hypothetical protein